MYAKNRWLILTMVASALFLIVIDMTVLYTALPRLTQALDASASQKLWIVNAYPLVVAGLLPGAGMLSDRVGHKRLFLAGLPVFAVASLCAAFSPTAEWLIAARVFLAVGAAMMMPATLSIVRHVFTDERERALAIGIWASVASGGAAIGPVVGGLLLEYFWWGSVFLINVPVVLLVWPLAWKLIPRCGDNPRPADIVGSVQIMIGLVGAIYALKELSKPAPDVSALLAAALIGILFLALFVRRQQRSAHPMIDFSLFRNRLFAGGIGVALLSMVALIGVELVLSQRLQLVLGLSPLQAALFILPIPLASALAGPMAGLLLPRYGERSIILGGFALTAFGIAGLALLYQSSIALQLVSLALVGFGLGGVITAASTAIMLNAPEEKSGMAASIEDVSYELGGVLGVTLLGGLMTAVYSHSLALPAELPVSELAYDSIDEALRLAAGMAADRAQQLTQLARLAFDRAFIMVLIAAALLMALGAGVVKLALRK